MAPRLSAQKRVTDAESSALWVATRAAQVSRETFLSLDKHSNLVASLCDACTNFEKKKKSNSEQHLVLHARREPKGHFVLVASVPHVAEVAVPEVVYLSIPRVPWMSSLSFCFLDEGKELLVFEVSHSLAGCW